MEENVQKDRAMFWEYQLIEDEIWVFRFGGEKPLKALKNVSMHIFS